ncbi:MAG: hypothetical protein FJ087_11955 [Deltaproteobacteria bacterium]|nr:hypothetical protein [Deltaproteobacteria bacterium]
MSAAPGETRTAGELAQPGCSMTGFATAVAGLAHDLAVVIFGERDCSNAFQRVSSAFSSLRRWPVFTAAIRETDVVAGAAEARLEECLRAVIRHRHPRAVLVLSTCLAEVIGADPGPPCTRVEADTGVRCVAVRTSGLVPRTQAEVADHVAAVLVGIGSARRPDRGEPAVPDGGALNLLGYATGPSREDPRTGVAFRAEVRAVLARVGLRLNAAAPAGAALRDWGALPAAGFTAVSDRALFGGLLRLLDRPDHSAIEVRPPVGLAATDAFLAAIAHGTGRDVAAVADAARALPAREAAVAALARARARHAGRHVAYGIGSMHDFRPEHLAWEGLSHLPALLEAGLEVELLIQERDRPEVHARIRRNLAAAGASGCAYRLFYEPAVAAPVLRDGRFDLAYLPDFLADQAAAAGVPFLPFGALDPGYAGAARIDRVLDAARTWTFRERYGRHLGRGGGDA